MSNINNDLNKLCKNFLTSECRKNFSLTQIKNNIDFIEKNSSKIFEILIENKKEFIIKNNNTIRTAKINLSLDNELNNYIIKNFEKFNTIRVFKNGNIEISNLSPINIAVKTVNFYQKSQNKKIICSSYNSNKSIDKFASYSFQVNNLNKNCPEKDLFFKIEYTANNKIYTSEGFAIPNHFNKKKFLNNLKDIPLPDSLATLKKQTFYIKKGTYKINEPIIIPEGYNLKIEMGTTLNFSENSFILLLGGDIVLDGNVKNTIKLQAQDKNWGGIFVRNSSNSRISYSVIDKTNFFNDYNNMFFLTGGINFYKSNVIINNTIIKNSDAEDSINFTNSNFLIKNSEFINSKSDAIDSDYSKGSVENSSFDKIYGDAIDISGSKINIINIKINNTKDKGLSAGENSIANIQKSKIENAQIAIAAKDGTKVSGDDVEFLNNAQDLAAYLKKPMYLKSGEIYLRNLKDIDLKILKDKNGIVNLNNINIEQINYNYSSNAK